MLGNELERKDSIQIVEGCNHKPVKIQQRGRGIIDEIFVLFCF